MAPATGLIEARPQAKGDDFVILGGCQGGLTIGTQADMRGYLQGIALVAAFAMLVGLALIAVAIPWPS